jgi:phospholipase C
MTGKHPVDRRRFLSIAGGAAAATALSSSVARAARIVPAVRTRTIKDVAHIVVLMQENRSFDHYFGTLRGVRGFGPTGTTCGPGTPATTGPTAPRAPTGPVLDNAERGYAWQTYPERLEAAGVSWKVSSAAVRLTLTSADGSERSQLTVPARSTVPFPAPAAFGTGWYDLSVTSTASPGYLRGLAGHVETGQPSVSDPALGRS